MTPVEEAGGKCKWCDKVGRYAHENYSARVCGVAVEDPVRVPVCTGCYYALTRPDSRRFAKYRLWGIAFATAVRLGIPFKIRYQHVPTLPLTCPVEGVELVYTYPVKENPETPNHAVLIPDDHATGFLPGRIKIVSRKAARFPGAPTREQLLELFRQRGGIEVDNEEVEDEARGPCEWESHEGTYHVDMSEGRPIVVPVCKNCYNSRTRKLGADHRWRLWAEAYVLARTRGLPFDLRVNDIPKNRPRCAGTGQKMEFRPPGKTVPRDGSHAVLVPNTYGMGFVRGNLRLVREDESSPWLVPDGDSF